MTQDSYTPNVYIYKALDCLLLWHANMLKKKKHFKDYTQSQDHLEPENIPVHESQL